MQTLENDYIMWKYHLEEAKEGQKPDFVFENKNFVQGEHHAHRVWYEATENKPFSVFQWQDEKKSVVEFQKWREDDWKQRKDLLWGDYKTEKDDVIAFAVYRAENPEKRDTLVYTDW